MTDGVSLKSTSHPVAPWWKRLWLWLAHRDLNPEAIETVEIELTQEMIDQSVAALAPKPGMNMQGPIKPVKIERHDAKWSDQI